MTSHPVGEAVGHHRVAVVLDRDLHAAVARSPHRVVGAAVAEGELLGVAGPARGPAAGGPRQMPNTGTCPSSPPTAPMTVRHRRRVAGAVGEEHAVGVAAPAPPRRSSRRARPPAGSRRREQRRRRCSPSSRSRWPPPAGRRPRASGGAAGGQRGQVASVEAGVLAHARQQLARARARWTRRRASRPRSRRRRTRRRVSQSVDRHHPALAQPRAPAARAARPGQRRRPGPSPRAGGQARALSSWRRPAP